MSYKINLGVRASRGDTGSKPIREEQREWRGWDRALQGMEVLETLLALCSAGSDLTQGLPEALGSFWFRGTPLRQGS